MAENDDSRQDSVDNDNIGDNDSFEGMMSMADETEYLRADLSSPKSKVKKWLQKSNPQSIENKENLPVARRERPNQQNFDVGQSAKNKDTTVQSVLEQFSLQAQKRQEFICNFFSKEQELDQQRFSMLKDLKKPGKPT